VVALPEASKLSHLSEGEFPKPASMFVGPSQDLIHLRGFQLELRLEHPEVPSNMINSNQLLSDRINGEVQVETT